MVLPGLQELGTRRSRNTVPRHGTAIVINGFSGYRPGRGRRGVIDELALQTWDWQPDLLPKLFYYDPARSGRRALTTPLLATKPADRAQTPISPVEPNSCCGLLVAGSGLDHALAQVDQHFGAAGRASARRRHRAPQRGHDGRNLPVSGAPHRSCADLPWQRHGATSSLQPICPTFPGHPTPRTAARSARAWALRLPAAPELRRRLACRRRHVVFHVDHALRSRTLAHAICPPARGPPAVA